MDIKVTRVERDNERDITHTVSWDERDVVPPAVLADRDDAKVMAAIEANFVATVQRGRAASKAKALAAFDAFTATTEAEAKAMARRGDAAGAAALIERGEDTARRMAAEYKAADDRDAIAINAIVRGVPGHLVSYRVDAYGRIVAINLEPQELED